MSATFLDDASVKELSDLFAKTPLPVLMRAFEEVDNSEIAVFLLLLDVAATPESSDGRDEIQRTLAGDVVSEEQPDGTLTEYAQQIFAEFPMQRQLRIAEYLAETEMIQTAEAEEIWKTLVEKLNGILQNTLFFGSGPKNLAKLLEKVDIERQNQLMEVLQRNKPTLVDTVSDQLFTFDDLVDVPDHTITTLLQVLETNTLILALHDASPDIQEKFFENMDSEQVEIIETESEKLTFDQKQLGDTARQSVVSLVRNFAAKGLLKIH